MLPWAWVVPCIANTNPVIPIERPLFSWFPSSPRFFFPGSPSHRKKEKSWETKRSTAWPVEEEEERTNEQLEGVSQSEVLAQFGAPSQTNNKNYWRRGNALVTRSTEE